MNNTRSTSKLVIGANVKSLNSYRLNLIVSKFPLPLIIWLISIICLISLFLSITLLNFRVASGAIEKLDYNILFFASSSNLKMTTNSDFWLVIPPWF